VLSAAFALQQKKRQRLSTLPFEFFQALNRLRFLFADFSFVDSHIEMLDRFGAMSMEIVLGDFELMLPCPHVFKAFVNMRMRRWQSGCRCRAGPCGRRECEGQQDCCGDREKES
jgi:hypothetical protein